MTAENAWILLTVTLRKALHHSINLLRLARKSKALKEYSAREMSLSRQAPTTFTPQRLHKYQIGEIVYFDEFVQYFDVEFMPLTQIIADGGLAKTLTCTQRLFASQKLNNLPSNKSCAIASGVYSSKPWSTRNSMPVLGFMLNFFRPKFCTRNLGCSPGLSSIESSGGADRKKCKKSYDVLSRFFTPPLMCRTISNDSISLFTDANSLRMLSISSTTVTLRPRISCSNNRSLSVKSFGSNVVIIAFSLLLAHYLNEDRHLSGALHTRPAQPSPLERTATQQSSFLTAPFSHAFSPAT